MRVRAAVCHAVGGPLEVHDVDLAGPGPGEVLVRIRATGVCASDVHIIDGRLPKPMPIVPGHEAAGEVVEAGAGVDALQAGDHVVPTLLPWCGSCARCRLGRTRDCAQTAALASSGTLLDGTTRLSWKGARLHHFTGTSTWAEHAVVPASGCVRVDDDVPFATAALLGCAVATGVGAVRRVARPVAGETVAIVGCGGVGLAAVQAARMVGAEIVVAADVDAGRLALAQRLGATHAVSTAGRDVDAAVREILPDGADHVVECVGRPETVASAWRATRWGGQTTVVGLLPAGSTLHLDGFDLLGGKRLIGTYLGGFETAEDVPLLAALVRDGVLRVADLVDEIGLDDLPDAVTRLRAGSQRARQVVVLR